MHAIFRAPEWLQGRFPLLRLLFVSLGVASSSAMELTRRAPSAGPSFPSAPSSLPHSSNTERATFLLLRKLPKPLGYLYAVTVITFAMFLLGSQAFANYYYVVSGLLLFLIAAELRYSTAHGT